MEPGGRGGDLSLHDTYRAGAVAVSREHWGEEWTEDVQAVCPTNAGSSLAVDPSRAVRFCLKIKSRFIYLKTRF